MPRFSLVIPVYNMEATVGRCLESICRQSYDDWEAIVVDDGSTDGTARIVEDWIRRSNDRISLIRQPNGGLSAARNTGIERTRGEFLTFVDADDELTPDTLRALACHLACDETTDLLEYTYAKVDGDWREDHRFPNASYDSLTDYWLAGRAYTHSFACNKVFRRSLFDGVRFPEGMVFEDIHTLPLLASKARRMATTPDGCYLYHQNPLGITRQATARETRMLLEGNLKVLEPMLQDERLAAERRLELSRCYLHVLEVQLTLAKQGDDQALLPRYDASWRACENGKQFIKLILLRLLGIKRLCNLQKRISASSRRAK